MTLAHTDIYNTIWNGSEIAAVGCYKLLNNSNSTSVVHNPLVCKPHLAHNWLSRPWNSKEKPQKYDRCNYLPRTLFT